jgi:hypothetical protein
VEKELERGDLVVRAGSDGRRQPPVDVDEFADR